MAETNLENGADFVAKKPALITEISNSPGDAEKKLITEIRNNMQSDPDKVLRQLAGENSLTQNKSQKKTEADEALLSQSNEISKDEFDKLPRSTDFKFHFNHNGADLLTEFAIKGNEVQIAAELPFDARTMMPSENLAYFAVQKDGKKLLYPPANQQDIGEKTDHGNESYYIENLKPRKLETDKSKIDRLTPADVVDALQLVQGNELTFYTGAGISMGGEKPVWGMAQLKNELGLNDPHGLFLQTFANPDKNPPSELAGKVDEFRKLLFEDASTPAHERDARIRCFYRKYRPKT